jgi:hypothetical protein
VLHVGVWRFKAAVADWHNALQLKALDCQGAYGQLAKQRVQLGQHTRLAGSSVLAAPVRVGGTVVRCRRMAAHATHPSCAQVAAAAAGGCHWENQERHGR